MTRLKDLARLGQSYWLDDLTRAMIRSGELQWRVTDEGLSGVTTNPATFGAAISGSRDYDAQISELAGQPTPVIYEALITTDVRDACDILRPVYDRTAGRDGFVSIEVSPHLAHDTQGTIAEARRYWSAVARPNLFIKVPGTPAGVPAIEELLVGGINVNVTLLFSVAQYEAVAFAYLRALERRQAQNQSVASIASVASLFLSRIDVLVDELLQEKIRQGNEKAASLLGRCAVANAKLAYQRFKEIVASERWRSLANAGAHPQRLLWASTGTKNPAYDELMYVEPLIGPDTVNTMPAKTLAAFGERGNATPSLEEGIEEARRVMDELAAAGVDFRQVTEQLLQEGIRKFVEPYDRLLGTLAKRAKT